MLPMSHVVITSLAVLAAEKMQVITNVDYRWVALGSLLPDIIDKPIWRLLYDESWHAARFIGHTPFFALLLLLLGWIFWRQTSNNFLVIISLGCFLHLFLDAMWRIPALFYWPLRGWKFPKLVADVQLVSISQLQTIELWCGGILLVIIVKYLGCEFINRKNGG